MTVRGKQIATTVWIYQDQLDKLEKLRETTKVPMAVRIREAIDAILKKYEMKKEEERNEHRIQI